MRIHEPRRPDSFPHDDAAPSRTDQLIADAHALALNADRSIAETNASLKQSRAFISANAAGNAREPFARLCIALANEMHDVGYQPAAELVRSWRERLLAAVSTPANAETPRDG